MSGPAPQQRLAALDVVRGLAVLGMVWVHLVATEGGENPFERGVALCGSWIYELPAPLFCVLLGVSLAIQAERAHGRAGGDRRLLRRALVLALAGIAFGRTVWPTEILSPMAGMMVLGLLAWRLGTLGLLVLLLATLLAMPIGYGWFGDLAWTDWNEDGTVHRAEREFGWVTLRYYLYTGNYPLVGWLAFPLFGALAVRLGLLRRTVVRWHAVVVPPLAAAVLAANGWLAARVADGHFDDRGDLAYHLAVTWVPTTIPFVLACTLVAWGAVALALACDLRWGVLATLGRASLTHYVVHLLVVFVPLRLAWPAEDWSITVGIAGFAGYLLVAIPASSRWFRRRRRGPLEAAWAAASGKAG